MSIACQKRVWDFSKHKGGDLLVLLVVADHTNDDGTGAWPSIGRLARLTRLSERAVQYSLRKLEHSGELVIEKNSGPRGCNSYRVFLGCKDCTPEIIAPVQSVHPPSPANIAPEEGVKPTAPDPSSTKEPSIRKATKKGPVVVPEPLQGFDRILRNAEAGYSPTADFLAKVLDKYQGLDLEEEAIKMTGWLQSKKGQGRNLNSGFLLNWLKKATEDRRNGTTGDKRGTERRADPGVVGTSAFAKYG